ncbi:hypothetical protein DNTS_011026 [Danionella cerebrum]|uniref:NIDO domain-containing protein n=1 Tax=Danionella cerebrum TaxID=2873325 RepID=A0A553PMZ5_9TELE|nr:hypothetical protein DNTS_011026 [Danionella translucida]TRY79044.1 hypothetical protein DNTS_011026 [Danionella translucida]
MAGSLVSHLLLLTSVLALSEIDDLIFYPSGSGVCTTLSDPNETFLLANFTTAFKYFGRTYTQVYVNNNGLLTFKKELPESSPIVFPSNGNEDYIAPLWSDLDDVGLGTYCYQQYSNGNVLDRATQDINQYFPNKGFVASWVFVATWDTTSTDQSTAGFDTIGSTNFFVIPNSSDGQTIPNLKSSSNIGTPGRWAFVVNKGTVNTVGLHLHLSSISNLTDSGNVQVILDKVKQKLVSNGLPSNIQLNLKKVLKKP